MLGAFDDYFSLLEGVDAKVTAGQQLAEFKGWLGPHIRRGWRKLEKEAALVNAIGCRTDLAAPKTRGDGCYDQKLPTKECGTPNACGLDQYLGNQAASLGELLDKLYEIDDADSETERRIKSLRRLLEGPRGEKFKGADCFACGDALICHESPPASTVISKNQKHFEPLCEILGRTFQGYPVEEPVG